MKYRRPLYYFWRGVSRIIAPFQRDSEITAISKTSDDDASTPIVIEVHRDLTTEETRRVRATLIIGGNGKPSRIRPDDMPPDNWYK